MTRNETVTFQDREQSDGRDIRPCYCLPGRWLIAGCTSSPACYTALPGSPAASEMKTMIRWYSISEDLQTIDREILNSSGAVQVVKEYFARFRPHYETGRKQ